MRRQPPAYLHTPRCHQSHQRHPHAQLPGFEHYDVGPEVCKSLTPNCSSRIRFWVILGAPPVSTVIPDWVWVHLGCCNVGVRFAMLLSGLRVSDEAGVVSWGSVRGLSADVRCRVRLELALLMW